MKTRLEKLRAAVSERATKITELLTLPEEEQTDERAAELEALVAEQEAEQAEVRKLEDLAERATKAANVPQAPPASPAFIGKAGSVEDLDVRSAQRTEVRDAAKRILDEARAKPAQLSAIERMMNGHFPEVDGAAIERHVVLTERPEYRSAFQKYINGNGDLLTDAEKRAVTEARAMGGTTDASGGYGVPVTIDPTILLTDTSSRTDILSVIDIEPVFTDAWKGVSAAAAVWSFDGELTEVSDDSLTLAQPSIDVHEARAFVPYSMRWAEDYPGAAAQLERAIAGGYNVHVVSKLMTGTGVGQPWGLFGTTMTTVDVSSDNNFLAADIDAVWKALGEDFRYNATWVMNVDVENDIRGFGSGTATSRFTVDQTRDGISLLNGRRVILSDYAPQWSGTDGASILVLGDMKYFKMAQRIGMQVQFIPQVFGATNGLPLSAHGLLARARWGSDKVVQNAFRRLKNITT